MLRGRWLGAAAATLLAGCATAPHDGLHGASWAIQLQGLDRPGAVDRLAAAPHDLLVIDPVRTVRGLEDFPTRDVVARLRRAHLCLAYLNVGQAESYRESWRPHWRAPTADRRGEPAYLLAPDPEGWPDNYPVAFWDLRWRGVLWGAPDAPLDRILADGFDGVFLDWVLGWSDPRVAAAAREAGVDPAEAMVELVADLARYARRRRPGFLVVALNAASLARRAPRLLDHVDAVAQEDLSFAGAAGAAWDDAGAGDRPVPSERRAELLAALRPVAARGVPVLVLDYARDPENARRARALAAAEGFSSFVSRTALDRLP